ncbi:MULTISPECIES: alpha-glucosidase [unclassified Facklamia]|uniref:glycoside hydrolase family 13 protein n=1 Tax=Aerococcaceae TaxID=186827 RepID=UPI0013BDDC7D|nr:MULTISPECIES: alpha-glucosidase [unclassified Facklamia]NEW63825.1 alpha,alpha-phosphotrehalase [Facklamia sp. 252]NEW67296.1 alpha,alpha-phosphotrehalase [Facklamia sp. 253]QQD65177.1 alpha-glucosidase [Aerococcaceae bacterium zg-252]
MEQHWWQNVVVYQVYPRSFQDSNGDGIGDLQGIISRLDYLEKLGIGAIWLSPVYASPNRDNGYDISDYLAIMTEFGTMADMERLISEAKKRNIEIIMDLVVNHSSDQHAWFVEARKSKDNPYRDYYIWRDAVDGKEPNELQAAWNESAWQWDEVTGQYYFHLFSKEQPDLNWDNPRLRQEVYDMMNQWVDKGIGGFRMDVIDLIGKIPDESITVNGPKLHDYLQEMHREVLAGHDLMTVGETWSADVERAKLYSNPERKELSMIFQFEHIMLDQAGSEKWDLAPLSIPKLKIALSRYQTELGNDGWNSLFWNNHDTPRIVSRWGNDKEWRERSAKLFAILLHTMKGTPYIYQGEEIGMTNRPIESIDQADDIESINFYHDALSRGISHDQAIRSINAKGRDNARTPMQWDSTPHAGFTNGKPWLAVNENYVEINVESALDNPDSIFYTYQRLIQLRKNHSIVTWGEYKLLDTVDNVFAFERLFEDEVWVTVANISADNQGIDLSGYQWHETLISNINSRSEFNGILQLAPYEAFCIRVTR